MAGITFVDRKNDVPFDASFCLHNGKTIGDVSSWHVGDHVGVCFADQSDKIAKLLEYGPAFERYPTQGDFLMVRCVVKRRFHSIVWRDIGKFESLTTCDVTLEAESGFWEDVLAWVIVRKKPEWIPDE